MIAELKGPGVITRIWTPTPNDSPLEFFFDGETTPRLVLPFRQIFEGTTRRFLPRSQVREAADFTAMSRFRFSIRAKSGCTDRRCSFSKSITGFTSREQRLRLSILRTFAPTKCRAIRKVWGDVANEVIPSNSRTDRNEQVLEAGKSVTLFSSQKPGRVIVDSSASRVGFCWPRPELSFSKRRGMAIPLPPSSCRLAISSDTASAIRARVRCWLDRRTIRLTRISRCPTISRRRLKSFRSEHQDRQ